MGKLVKELQTWRILVFFCILSSAAILVSCSSQKKESSGSLEYRASITAEKNRYSIQTGGKLHLKLKLKNTGQKTWSSSTANPCLLSYHLYDADNQIIQFDNRRFSLPGETLPGQTVDITMSLLGPLGSGSYSLEVDLLREGLFWFKDKGSSTLEIPLSVQDRPWERKDSGWSLDFSPETAFISSVDELNTLFKLIRLTLEESEVEFKGETGHIFGFSAGTEYPQIWTRDANSILFASKLFYGPDYLTSWIEEHLAFQDDNGSIQDWIDAKGQHEKNTTETDQECSIVQSAYHVTRLIGLEWLEKKIDGQAIISRLDKALMYVLNNRFDKNTGLITGAHTIDWGDVDMIDTGDAAVDVDSNTVWTVDIYDQGMFCLAAAQLASLYEKKGIEDRASFWTETAESIISNANTRLWQADKGFYRVHLHLDSSEHDFDETDMFALGGNVSAITGGLAHSEQKKNIILEALQRQEIYGLSTVSGTILPPYAQGVFKHPLVDSPYEYQNGAQWDWFGGRLIHTMFLSGFSEEAKSKLLEIAAKNIANRGFYEWDDKTGTGRGSDFFCGSAGSLSQALFEGYLGIMMTGDSLLLEPRLLRDNGRVRVYFPASGSFAAYEYSFFPEKDKIEFAFNSNCDTQGQVRILSPWNSTLDPPADRISDTFQVRRDGQPIPFSLSRINRDTYLVIDTDFKNRFLEIQKK